MVWQECGIALARNEMGIDDCSTSLVYIFFCYLMKAYYTFLSCFLAKLTTSSFFQMHQDSTNKLIETK